MTKFCTTGSWRHRSALHTPCTVNGRAHLGGDVIEGRLGERSSGQEQAWRNKHDVITENPIQIRIREEGALNVYEDQKTVLKGIYLYKVYIELEDYKIHNITNNYYY